MRIRVIAATAALSVVAACGGGDKSTGPAGTTNTNTSTNTFGGSATATLVVVNMPGTTFNPNNIDIAQNGVVQFVFADVTHDVRFNGAAGAPADILATQNVTVNRTFATKGTFPFVCTLHANMTGTVVVH